MCGPLPNVLAFCTKTATPSVLFFALFAAWGTMKWVLKVPTISLVHSRSTLHSRSSSALLACLPMTAPFQFSISFCPSCVLCPGHALVIYRYQSYPSGLLHVLDLNLCLCLSLACHSVACHHSFIPRKHTEQSKPHANAQMPYISSATLTKPMPLLGWLDPPRCKLPPTFDPILMRGSTAQSPIPLFSFAAVSTTMTSTMKPKHNFKKRLAAHVSCFNSDSLAMLLPCFSAPTSQLESHMHDALGPVLWTFE